MLVNRDEALECLRQAIEARAVQARQSDERVNRQTTFRNEAQLAVDDLGRVRVRAHGYQALVEQLANRRACGPWPNSPSGSCSGV